MRAIRYLNTSADKAVPKQLNSVGAEMISTLGRIQLISYALL